MSEFQPQNLQNAWKILADYIEYNRRYANFLREKYPESFETWGLIIQLYDTYKEKTVQSDLQRQIVVILSRAKMPRKFDSVYNDYMQKIYLQDLLLYISGELHFSSSEETDASVDPTDASVEPNIHVGLGARSASRRRSVVELLNHMTMLVDVM